MTRAWLLILLLFVGAAACLWYVLRGQYAEGTVYADYSSWRTDRMGTAALYEALSKIVPQVSRNEIPLQDLTAKNAELLVLGLSPTELDANLISNAEELAKAGNRVVIALDGSAYIFNLMKINEPLWLKWRVRLVDDRKTEHGPRAAIVFEPQSSSGWNRSGTALTRQFGTGAIVLLGSSWRFTNAALRDERDVGEITSVIGAPTQILFDETHLGSVEQGSVMGLIRRFRLHGVLAAAILCALLFIWQSSVPFPPERASAESDAYLTAASVGEGLLNLLAHHIPANRLMNECIAEWRRDRGRLISPDKLRQLEIIAAQKTHPLTQWREIRALLDKKIK